jgi:hypothetical protein
MMDQGLIRNAVYNMDAKQIPDISKVTYSKALGVHNQGMSNQTFFSFGSRNTNFRNHIMKTDDQRYLNKTMANLKSQFNQTRDLDLRKAEEQNKEILEHIPRTIMNDYTKNISEAIHAPGVIR